MEKHTLCSCTGPAFSEKTGRRRVVRVSRRVREIGTGARINRTMLPCCVRMRWCADKKKWCTTLPPQSGCCWLLLLGFSMPEKLPPIGPGGGGRGPEHKHALPLPETGSATALYLQFNWAALIVTHCTVY